ncbi:MULTISPECIES: hypothetical protein [unclassified Streptomyces]|uniref:hypothetical protein n=1 Tax=unclassified Streptomyces TaxID=2593676 RepID=UPI00131D391B|nr:MULTISPECIES: hypothetical protein [unclassified Streptomyces]
MAARREFDPPSGDVMRQTDGHDGQGATRRDIKITHPSTVVPASTGISQQTR